jgi:hypothetical protein
MRPVNRVSPAVIAAFVASAVILVGFIAFFINASRSQQAAPGNVNVTVGGGPTPTTVAVNVNLPTTVPTLVPPPTVTSAPLATLPPEPTAVPTRTPPPPPTAPPPPTRVAADVPPPRVQVEPPTVQSDQATPPPEAAQAPGPAAQQPLPAGQAPGGQAAPKPTGPAQVSPPNPAPGQAPANQPPSQGLAPAPTPPGPVAAQPKPGGAAPPAALQPLGTNPSPTGGIGNTRQDIVAAYGQPGGRSPEGLEVFQTGAAEIQVAFEQERAARIRYVLRNDRTVALDEARNLARRLLPSDAAPTGTSGEETGRPIDDFRSVALGAALPRGGGNVVVRYTPAAQGKFSGFDVAVGG